LQRRPPNFGGGQASGGRVVFDKFMHRQERDFAAAGHRLKQAVSTD
jgi:hypothetical protein